MRPEQPIEIWAGIWIVTAALLIVRHWRADRGVGLLFAFLVTFGLLHWLAPVLSLLPWYQSASLEFVAAGLRQSTYAVLAFAVGVEFASWLTRHSVAPRDGQPLAETVDRRTVILFLIGGAFLYAVVFPVAGRVPSATALVSAGSTLIVVALGLKCWNAWCVRDRKRIIAWLLVSTSLPLITVVTQGFLGYGFGAMLTVFAFVASFYRPRRHVFVLALVLAYLGLSVYVTYMRDRSDIRDVVWTGAGLSERAARLYTTFTDVEWFDPYEAQHLWRIDVRLNQNYLLGAAMALLESTPDAYARGETIRQAALAIVPRAIWPNKPIVAGGGELVSTYTGIRFAEGTSVGIGQVMESYVNFGTTGVVASFFLIGALIMVVDRKARLRLEQGDIYGFAFWFLPGLSLLQVGGSFVEVTSSATAALVVAVLLRRATPLLLSRPPTPEWRSSKVTAEQPTVRPADRPTS